MIFYAPNCTLTDTEYTLSEIESKHCIKVLRQKIGGTIELVNGLGGHFICKIIDDHFKKCKVQIKEKTQHSAPRNILHIAMAIPKSSERLEWFLEKATELGITKLTMINCDNSERRTLNEKRLKKIAITALKQSKRYYLPEVEGPVPFSTFLLNEPKGYIGHCYEAKKMQAKDIVEKNPILIGPEGDFSINEVALAQKSGYVNIELSSNRLRTETAALAGVFYLANV